MRSRYSAHVLGLVDYVVATYHPSCEAEQHREAIAESVNSHWLGLEVINSEIATDVEGFVEFKAFYQEGNEQYCLHERSRFLKEWWMATPNGFISMASTQSLPWLKKASPPRLSATKSAVMTHALAAVVRNSKSAVVNSNS